MLFFRGLLQCAGDAIAVSNRGGKAIPLAHHRLHETRLLRIVAQDEADLTHSRVDAVVDIDENFLAPQAVSDLLAGNEFSAPLDQQDEQLHREFFQAQQALASLQPITRLIECEIAEMEFLGRIHRVRWAEFVSENDAPSATNMQLLQ